MPALWGMPYIDCLRLKCVTYRFCTRVQSGVTDFLTFKSDDMKIEIDSEFLKALTNLVKWLVVLTLVMA